LQGRFGLSQLYNEQQQLSLNLNSCIAAYPISFRIKVSPDQGYDLPLENMRCGPVHLWTITDSYRWKSHRTDCKPLLCSHDAFWKTQGHLLQGYDKYFLCHTQESPLLLLALRYKLNPNWILDSKTVSYFVTPSDELKLF